MLSVESAGMPFILRYSLLTSISTLRKAYDAGQLGPNVNFKFSHNTSNSSLRPHIEKHHLELFKTLAEARGWPIHLKGLVLQAQSQAASEAAASQVGQIVEFNQEALNQYLLSFIVANDQVRYALVWSIYMSNLLTL